MKKGCRHKVSVEGYNRRKPESLSPRKTVHVHTYLRKYPKK